MRYAKPRCAILSASLIQALLTAVIMALMSVQAAAQEAIADFYKGKQIKVISGSAAGGGYDFYARLLARHLGRFIPGNPTIIVQNQPGAGSVVAANAVYATQPQDGTVIAGIQPGAPFEKLLEHDGPQFEVAKIKWLGSLNSESGIVLTLKPSKVETFEDLKRYDSVWGTSGRNLTEQYPSMLTHMFGAKIRQVSGYKSIVEAYLALERGEVEGVATQWASIRRRYPTWFPERKANFLAQISLVKQSDLPGVPMILDLVTEKNLLPEFKRDEAEAIWRVMLIQLSMARPFFVGPGVPDARLAALRKAFNDMTADKEFLVDAAKGDLDIVLLKGEELQKMMDDAAKTPKSTLDKVSVVAQPN